jgi:hypothetical protein
MTLNPGSQNKKTHLRKVSQALALLIALTACGGHGYKGDGKAGANPIFKNIFTADPAPLVVGDTLYVYTGHDEAGPGQMFNITEWVVYSTTDMKHWTFHGPVMKPTDFSWAVSDAWASQAIEKNGKFWFYTTVEHKPPYKTKAIGVAVADTPLGPFKDARGTALANDATTPTPEDPHDWDDIDPTVFTDVDGTTWLAWGNMHLYLAKLKSNMIEFDGAIREIYLPNYTEGPWLHARKGMYYLTYACFAHQNMFEKICYATAPRISGPWTYQGILTDRTKNSFTIHPGIVEYKGQWYFFYHQANLSINGLAGAMGRRSVEAQYLYYNEDGTIKPIRKTKAGLSIPPAPTADYRGPVFNPDGPLVAVKSDIEVIENTGTALTAWPGNPALRTLADPYNTAIAWESFNRGDSGVTCLGQTFSLDAPLKLQEISLYAGDGFGTIEDKPVTLALYELAARGAKANAASYTAGKKNLLGPDDGLQINYRPQPRGLLRLRLAQSRQPVLQAGKRYVLELQGVRGSAPLFWRRTPGDVYPAGAAYQDRMLIQDNSVTADFGMALYGETQSAGQ